MNPLKPFRVYCCKKINLIVEITDSQDPPDINDDFILPSNQLVMNKSKMDFRRSQEPSALPPRGLKVKNPYPQIN